MNFIRTPQTCSLVVISGDFASAVTSQQVNRIITTDAGSRSAAMQALTVGVSDPRVEVRRDLPLEFPDGGVATALRTLLGRRRFPVESLGVNFHVLVTAGGPAAENLVSDFFQSAVANDAALALVGGRGRAPWGFSIRTRTGGADTTVEFMRVEMHTAPVSAVGVLIRANYSVTLDNSSALREAIKPAGLARYGRHFDQLLSRVEKRLN